MKKALIHIGLHKTASTFLQEQVWPQLQGYTYLSRPYTQHNHAFNQLQYADDSLYCESSVHRELNAIEGDRLFLSDEAFSGKPLYFSYLNRSTIARRLKALFPNAEIIVFLRDQQDIILSHYSAYVNMPYGTKRLEELFYKPQTDYTYADYKAKPNWYNSKSLYYNTNDYFIHLDCFLYSHLISVFTQHFERVHVFLYEDLSTNPTAICSRLEAITGESIILPTDQRINASFSAKGLVRRRKANQWGAIFSNSYGKKIVRRAIQAYPFFSSTDLPKSIYRLVGDYYTRDNRMLKEQLPNLNWNTHPNKYT